MKRSIFGLLIISILLSSCNDDENENPGNGDPMQPQSGSISATINGNDFSSTDNVTRFLSYGSFIIKSEADGSFLNFELEDFVGNASYSLVEGLGNSTEYFTTVNGEFVGFRSLSGELIITEYNEATQTYNASFNIIFGRIGNSSITISGEGTYNNLEVLEIMQPASGEMTAFYDKQEYFDFTDSARVIANQAFVGNFESQNSNVSFEVSLLADNPESATISSAGNSFMIAGSEILSWDYDSENFTATGHFKRVGSDVDLEIWFQDIQVDTVGQALEGIAFFYNGSVIEFENGDFLEQELNDSESRYQFAGFNYNTDSVADHFFVFEMQEPVSTGFSQPLQGEVVYLNPNNPDDNFFFVPAVMTVQSGLLEGTVDVEVVIDEQRFLVGTGIEFVE